WVPIKGQQTAIWRRSFQYPGRMSPRSQRAIDIFTAVTGLQEGQNFVIKNRNMFIHLEIGDWRLEIGDWRLTFHLQNIQSLILQSPISIFLVPPNETHHHYFQSTRAPAARHRRSISRYN